MSLYKNKFNPLSGTFNLVPTNTIIRIKTPVLSQSNLPLTGNEIGDGIITKDTEHLYIWDGTIWVDQGNFIDVSWDSILDKPDLIESSGDGDWKPVTNIQYNSVTKQIRILYETL